MRKQRRKIKRRKRSKSKRKHRTWLWKQFNGTVTNKYTRITTAIIILLEVMWVVLEMTWFFVDVVIRGIK